MTEEEAKEKWCPHSMAGTGRAISSMILLASGKTTMREAEKYADDNENSDNCIASKCMAWRWNAPADIMAADGGVYQSPMPEPRSETHGYCGLAGEQ